MKLHPLVLALGLTPLVGCGGSSSSTPEPTPSVKTELSGKVADGYLVGAEVCLDINKNKLCDADEPSTISSDGGEFTLTGVTQSNIDAYSLLVKVIAGQTIDEDNPEEELKAYTLSAPAGFTFVSPLTTLVQNEVEKGSTVEEAEQQVQTKLGTGIKLNKDYVAAQTDAALSEAEQAEFTQLHQVAQVTADVIAANMDKLEAASEEADIPLEQLITLITDEVFDALAEITTQVEAVASNAEFDSTAIAENIDESINLDAEKIEEQSRRCGLLRS